VSELAVDVKDGSKKFDIVELKKQFESLISSQDDVTRLVNSLTFNEFESLEEVHAWLTIPSAASPPVHYCNWSTKA
jgi:hypothetical protein